MGFSLNLPSTVFEFEHLFIEPKKKKQNKNNKNLDT